jgi:predicted dehydrogenase
MPLRVGLVGFGLGGAIFHAPLIDALPAYELAAIVTSDPERRAQAQRSYPNTAVLDNADELWKRAGDRPGWIDLAVIASPNRAHVPQALAALDTGLAVVVDKPLAANAQEARLLIAQAERRQRPLTVFHNRRWDGDFLTVRRLIANQSLGDVWRLESRFERWRPAPRPGWREAGERADAGGLLVDLGSHLIDQALTLFGPVQRVNGELKRRRPRVVVDDDAFVALEHDNGVVSHLWMSSVAAQPGPRFRLLGSRAAFVKYGMDVQEEALRSGARPDRPGWGEDPPDRWGTLGAGNDLTRVPTERGAYPEFYVQLAAALTSNAPVPVNPTDALRTLTVIDAIRTML